MDSAHSPAEASIPAPYSADDPEPDGEPGAPGGRPVLTRGLTILMAVAVGLVVANLYYIQPLMGEIARGFAVPDSLIGYAVTLCQAGLAVGTLFILPLGDVADRRRLITLSCVGAAVSLVVMATAPNAWVFLGANFALGFTSIATHLQVSYAAHLADPKSRGRAVGAVMSGLLVGVLAARTVSGYAGAWFGWRAVIWFVAGITLALAVVLCMKLPRDDEYSEIGYGDLLGSMPGLLASQSILRDTCVYGALSFAVFNAFWATVTFHLEGAPFGMDSRTIGLFSLVAIAGALTANVAGRLTVVILPTRIIAAALVITLISFGIFQAWGVSIAGMVVGIILMDFGIQAAHIGNQTLVHGLMPEARNRLHCVYMVAYFVGGSMGSGAGTWSYARMGWTGLCLTGAVLSAVAVGYWLYRELPRRV